MGPEGWVMEDGPCPPPGLFSPFSPPPLPPPLPPRGPPLVSSISCSIHKVLISWSDSPQPHNPHDDRLVLKKHAAIAPLDSEVGILWVVGTCLCSRPSSPHQLKALQKAVEDVEAVLKQVSDDLLAEADR